MFWPLPSNVIVVVYRHRRCLSSSSLFIVVVVVTVRSMGNQKSSPKQMGFTRRRQYVSIDQCRNEERWPIVTKQKVLALHGLRNISCEKQNGFRLRLLDGFRRTSSISSFSLQLIFCFEYFDNERENRLIIGILIVFYVHSAIIFFPSEAPEAESEQYTRARRYAISCLLFSRPMFFLPPRRGANGARTRTNKSLARPLFPFLSLLFLASSHGF